MEEKKQFDELLGGQETLPHEMHIMKLVSARAGEIAAMTHSIDNPQQTKLIFQKLPVYMRRRVMSHNAKRLPRRLREAHVRQMTKSGLPPKSKRPSRKYRRRPHNLLLEYNRRQREKIWLETHIWHAKRFHMIEKWGYKIANFANDKCFKANYRAIMKHCLILDLSYYSCIEISGPNETLRKTLQAHCNPTQLTFNAKAYTSGKREGTLMFFRKNAYPELPIGNVHFLWRPSQLDRKKIWIWVHPSFYHDFLTEIISSFQMQPDNMDSDVSEAARASMHSTYTNACDCQIILLKNTMNRFRLCGPLALNTLTDALRLPTLCETKMSKENTNDNSVREADVELSDDQVQNTESSKMEIDDEFSIKKQQSSHIRDLSTTRNLWFLEYYSNPENVQLFNIQKSCWQMLQSLDSPNQLPPNIVLAFSVLDPRICTPKKRVKCQKRKMSPSFVQTPFQNVNESPIWDADIRAKVSQACTPAKEINDLRSSCLVPGVSNDDKFDESVISKVPILLIQRPGNSRTGFSAGVDIIFPAGWAMPFWVSFILRCARVGALRESRSMVFESFNLQSPDVNDPDTPAYEREALDTKKELEEKYLRYPPNRRVNFVKLGISSPFFCQWKILMKEWTDSENFYVLRDRQLIMQLQSMLCSKKQNTENQIEDIRDLFAKKNYLVRVKISIATKGRPKNFALICLPTNEDLDHFNSNNRWAGPVENLRNDPNESRRKKLRKSHLELLKRYKRQRVRYRRAARTRSSDIDTNNKDKVDALRNKVKKSLDSAREVVLAHAQKMSELYLPDCSKVRWFCDREVMGYITAGNFSFAEAKGVGIGYVTLPSLFEMISKRTNTVLIRNIQTRQYKVARLEVLPL